VVERYCSNCGQQLLLEEQFCPNCGRPAHETAHVPTPEADVPLPPPPQAETGGIASPPPEQAGAPPPQGQPEVPPSQEQVEAPSQGSQGRSRAVRSLVEGGIGALLLLVLLVLAWRLRDRGSSEMVFDLRRGKTR
jgi:hypothetical protein